jgi:hypothetical protein
MVQDAFGQVRNQRLHFLRSHEQDRNPDRPPQSWDRVTFLEGGHEGTIEKVVKGYGPTGKAYVVKMNSGSTRNGIDSDEVELLK